MSKRHISLHYPSGDVIQYEVGEDIDLWKMFKEGAVMKLQRRYGNEEYVNLDKVVRIVEADE